MKTNLCQCINCENVFYDENPQIGADVIDTENFEEVFSMELLNENGDSYWGCGFCKTDAYLFDISSEYLTNRKSEK